MPNSGNDQQEKSNTFQEISLMRQTISHLIEAQNDSKDQILNNQRELKENLMKELEDHETRIRKMESDVGKLSERLTLWQVGQTFFTTFIGAGAAILGRLK